MVRKRETGFLSSVFRVNVTDRRFRARIRTVSRSNSTARSFALRVPIIFSKVFT